MTLTLPCAYRNIRFTFSVPHPPKCTLSLVLFVIHASATAPQSNHRAIPAAEDRLLGVPMGRDAGYFDTLTSADTPLATFPKTGAGLPS